MECRGADTPEELARQRAKIVAALAGIDADVTGLIEIENNLTDGPTADLVSGLNDMLGAGTYAYIATGDYRHGCHPPGPDLQARRGDTGG